ncbi:MAG: HAD-IC family P-type ATPase [Tetrasphaera sp.]|nr:HAD-IC family P-type ATPase [Tetrasphaera sp.]
MVGTGRGAQLGILLRGPEVLESTRRVEVIVLDKTGTITTGVMSVRDVVAAQGESANEVLRMAGSLEHGSEHPIARAIADAAAHVPGGLAPISDFTSAQGRGVEGVVTAGERRHVVVAGRAEFLRERGIGLPDEIVATLAEAEAGGATAVTVGWDGLARGVVVVGDTVKPTSAQAISDLRGLGLRPVLLTGDNEIVARRVAAEVGIDEVIAGVLPEGKVEAIRELQQRGRAVAMVGDGVNDAAALAQADLGLAMGTGTDAAIAAADLTLVRGDLRAAGDAIRLSRATLATIKGNLFWAFAYNVAALPSPPPGCSTRCWPGPRWRSPRPSSS